MHLLFKRPLHHWNYYLSVESEFVETFKYVEFDEGNYETYSVEFTKLILQSCSEVDVLLTQIGAVYGQKKRKPNFGDHYTLVSTNINSLINEVVEAERYGIDIAPFLDWPTGEPSWHKVYNNLKHHRGLYYKEGNLKNALSSVGALFTTTYHYYLALALMNHKEWTVVLSDVVNSLEPKATLLRFQDGRHRWRRLN